MRLLSPRNDLRHAVAAEIPYLRRFARGLVGDASLADDLVQDTLERALTRLHLFDRRQKLRNWLFRILRNLSINNYRSLQRRGQHVELTEVSEVETSERPLQEDGLVMRDLANSLLRLPQEQREILLLISLEELSYKDAADILQVPIGTVMSRLSRGREALRQLVAAPATPKLRRIK